MATVVILGLIKVESVWMTKKGLFYSTEYKEKSSDSNFSETSR